MFAKKREHTLHQDQKGDYLLLVVNTGFYLNIEIHVKNVIARTCACFQLVRLEQLLFTSMCIID